MKKIVAGLLTLCLVFPAFIGCGPADSTPKKDGEFAPRPGSTGSSSAGPTSSSEKAKAKESVGQAAAPVE